MVIDWVDVQFRVIKVGRSGRDELGASGPEKFLKQGQRVWATTLQTCELVAVFVAQGGVNGVVEFGRVEGNADGDEGIHLVVLLADAVILSRLLKVFRSAHVNEDMRKHPDSIGIAAQHHVAEADVVVCGKVCSHDSGEHGLLVQFDIVECFNR